MGVGIKGSTWRGVLSGGFDRPITFDEPLCYHMLPCFAFMWPVSIPCVIIFLPYSKWGVYPFLRTVFLSHACLPPESHTTLHLNFRSFAAIPFGTKSTYYVTKPTYKNVRSSLYWFAWKPGCLKDPIPPPCKKCILLWYPIVVYVKVQIIILNCMYGCLMHIQNWIIYALVSRAGKFTFLIWKPRDKHYRYPQSPQFSRLGGMKFFSRQPGFHAIKKNQLCTFLYTCIFVT